MKDNVSLMDAFKSPQPERNFNNNQSSIAASPLAGRTFNINAGWFENQSVGETVKADDEFTLIYANEKTDGTTLRRLFAPNQGTEQGVWSQGKSESGQNTFLSKSKPQRCDPFLETQSRHPKHQERKNRTDKSDDDEEDEGNEDPDEANDPINLSSKKKFNKGLKLLSVIVRDIVVEKKSTTYKEVADIILRDTIKFENLNIHSQIEIAKEEQNIKRRVYDALNVLISAGILVKEGKKVRTNEVNKKIKINMKRMEINTMKSKMVG